MTKKSIAVQFGHILRELRTEAGLSQEAFADQCGLHRTYVGSIERGEKNITLETAHKIAKALGISLSALFIRFDATQTMVDSHDTQGK